MDVSLFRLLHCTGTARFGRTAAVALVLSAVAVWGIGGGAPSLAQGPAPMSLKVAGGSAVPDMLNGEIYVGLQKGWFKQAGLDVSLINTTGAAVAVSTLSAGQVDVFMGAPDVIPGAVAKQADVVSIYQFGYSPIWKMAYFNSKYQSLAGLKGATVGVVSLSSATIPILQAALKGVGLSPQDITMVPIGSTATAVALIQAGRADAAVWTTSWFPYLDDAHVKYTTQPFPGLTDNYPGLQLASTRTELANPSKRAALIKFLQVYTRVRKYCDGNLPGCAASYKTQSGDPEPVTQLIEQARDRKPIVTLPAEAKGQYGYTAAHYWQTLVTLQVAAGVIQSAIPASSLFTTELIGPANQGP